MGFASRYPRWNGSATQKRPVGVCDRGVTYVVIGPKPAAASFGP